MSWTTFVERKKQTDLVIVPTGAFEAYEPHLPLGSDSLVAANRKSFHRTGTEPVSYIGMDVPGMTPVVTEPGD